MEALLGGEPHAPVAVELVRCAEQVRPALAERVVHLRDDARQRVVGIAHEVEGDRVEDVPERTRVRQQLDAAVGHGDAARVEPAAHVVADREPRVAEVVGGAHLDQVAPVDREERDLARELVELVQIEQELVDPVAEGVVRRHVALVLEQRVVERGAGHHGELASARSAAAKPLAAPSSWKPQPRYAPA